MKTKSKIFRLNQDQIEQLESYLASENTNFTDLIHSLIQREILSKAPMVNRTVTTEITERIKVKRVLEVIKRYQDTDPNLLLQLAKIGNNINQIARVLNSIQHSSIEKHQQINFIELFLTLNNIKVEIENILPSIPKISRQPQETLIKKFTSISLDLGGNNAH